MSHYSLGSRGTTDPLSTFLLLLLGHLLWLYTQGRELSTLHNLRKLFVQDLTFRVRKVSADNKIFSIKLSWEQVCSQNKCKGRFELMSRTCDWQLLVHGHLLLFVFHEYKWRKRGGSGDRSNNVSQIANMWSTWSMLCPLHAQTCTFLVLALAKMKYFRSICFVEKLAQWSGWYFCCDNVLLRKDEAKQGKIRQVRMKSGKIGYNKMSRVCHVVPFPVELSRDGMSEDKLR